MARASPAYAAPRATDSPITCDTTLISGTTVCLTVLDEVLGGSDTPRATGPDAAARGWAALRDDYAEALGT